MKMAEDEGEEMRMVGDAGDTHGTAVTTRTPSKGRQTPRLLIMLLLVALLAVLVGVAIGVPLTLLRRRDTLEARLQIAKDILQRVPLIDGHNDFPWNLRLNVGADLARVNMKADLRKVFGFNPKLHPSHTDIPRLKQGHVGGQFWSDFAPCGETQYRDAVIKGLEQVDLIKRMIHKYPDVFEFVTTSDGIWKAFKAGKIASMIGLEGGHHLGNNLAILRMYYDLGVRYLTLTWSCNTPWADCYLSTKNNKTAHDGLTEWGKTLVREMNRLGMLVDLAHVAMETMIDALDISEAPVIFSHSSAYAICPHRRNVPDHVLRRLKRNNGVIMVNFYNDFINCTKENAYTGFKDMRTADLSQVADHLDHIKKVIGVDHIGIGGDFDGVDRVPTGLEDVSKYPYLFATLLGRGWTEGDLEKLAGLNIIRVMKKAEEISIRKKAVPPYDLEFDITHLPSEFKACMTTDWEVW